MLSSSLDTLLKSSKTTSPPKLFAYEAVNKIIVFTKPSIVAVPGPVYIHIFEISE